LENQQCKDAPIICDLATEPIWISGKPLHPTSVHHAVL